MSFRIGANALLLLFLPAATAAVVSLMGSDSVGCISCCDELPLFMHLSLWNRKQVHPSTSIRIFPLPFCNIRCRGEPLQHQSAVDACNVCKQHFRIARLMTRRVGKECITTFITPIIEFAARRVTAAAAAILIMPHLPLSPHWVPLWVKLAEREWRHFLSLTTATLERTEGQTDV